MSEADERFRNAILNFCANKSFAERMQLIAAILTAFGDLEAAGDNLTAARVLFDAAAKLARARRQSEAARTGPWEGHPE